MCLYTLVDACQTVIVMIIIIRCKLIYELWFTHTDTQGAGEAGDAGDRPPLLQPKAVNLSPPTQVRPVIYLMLSSEKSARSLPPRCRVEIWPGFITSILPYERHVMLCAEISHKILRTITVLEMMYDLYASARRDFHAEVTRKLVGAIVMTR